MEKLEVSSNHFSKIRNGPWKQAEKTHYRMVIDHADKTIHITGQESDNNDWSDNFDFKVHAEQWFSNNKNILVHAGFLRQYKSVRNILLDAVYQHPDYIIKVDGFSLGASWTQIFLQDVIHRWPDKNIHAVFYAPGNPWRKLPKQYQKALKRCTTFVRSIWDPVTWMKALRFYRYGKHITIGKWYRFWPLQHLPLQIIRGLDELEKQG